VRHYNTDEFRWHWMQCVAVQCRAAPVVPWGAARSLACCKRKTYVNAKMVDDNNMCDLIAAGALVALFTVCASDMRKLTAKVTY